ncbi:tetQ family GTPase, putative [Plasmodium malariae]|uniref:TetQ family GTPase, putative n=1 Tax=Plasmodium malariae TaxID=5858 RepID=A0A1C3L3F3_PLAMA|nr:tetQ family GTPase, putative [Plasmodium malariae]
MLKKILTVHNICAKYRKRFFCHELVNLGILAHIDAGKTTISEDILYNANEIRVKGNINDQNTQLDFLKQERERGITIKTAYSCFKWNEVHVNLIDTPGHVDFSNETFLSLCVSDKCVIVVDAKEGLQIQTINIFRYIKENIPIYFFLNKMDIHEADIEYNCTSIKNNLSKKSLLITYPIYENKKLKYILDLPSMLLYSYPQVKYGQKIIFKKIPLGPVLKASKFENVHNHFDSIEFCNDNIIPSGEDEHTRNFKILNILNYDIVDYVVKKREEIVEVLCDLDPELEYKYLNNIKINYDNVKKSLIKCINMKHIFPIFSGSALNSCGVHLLLDYVTYTDASYNHPYNSPQRKGKEHDNMSLCAPKWNDKTGMCLLSNKERNIVGGINGSGSSGSSSSGRSEVKAGGSDQSRGTTNTPNAISSRLIMSMKNSLLNKKYEPGHFFKTIIFIFKLVKEKNGYNTFCKVLKGKITKNSNLLNIRNNKNEIVKNIYKVKADRYIMTKELKTNDIGMIRGFQNILVCDIICETEEQKGDDQEKLCNKGLIDYVSQREENKRMIEDNKSRELVMDNEYDDDGKIKVPHDDVYSFNDIYKLMKGEIKNKELWYFLKSYKKRIRKNIVVCTCAIEPRDCRKEKELKKILNNICLEDNSIISYTDKNNKLIIGSIGILNIEVTLDKIRCDYNIDIRTEDVEIIQKEYIIGNYEDTIKKQMKVNSNFSSITVGLSIKEKEFVDISKYIQSVLKYDCTYYSASSKILKGEMEGETGGVEEDEADEVNDEEDVTFLKNEDIRSSSLRRNSSTLHKYNSGVERKISNYFKGTINEMNHFKRKVQINSNCYTNEQMENLKKELTVGEIFHSSYTGDRTGKSNSRKMDEYNHWCEKGEWGEEMERIKELNEGGYDEVRCEKVEHDEVNDENIDEYLQNLNYEDLFRSTVSVDKNVELYINELKEKKKKKKNFYNEILRNCIISLKNCLSNGYKTNGNIINTEIKITKLEIPDDCTIAVAKYACNDLYYKMIRKANVCIASPLSLLQIHTDESYVGIIVKDLIQYRNGSIIQIMENTEQQGFKIMKIIAIIPVKFTNNYASILRSISSGHANFFMTFCGYKKD